MSKMQSPRGCPDLFPDDIQKRLFIINTARELSTKYGFKEHETPIFEHSIVFDKNLGEGTDIVSKEMYTFTDKGGEQFTLRPEATASIARLFISHKLFREIPYKVFYQGPMFRHERPQLGRQRQFTQIGAESLGVKDPKIDAETIELGWSLIKKLGIEGESKVLINCLGTDKDREAYKIELVKFLKTRVSELSEDSQNRLNTNPLRILDSKSEQDQQILKSAPSLLNFLNAESLSEFKKIQSLLQELNVPFQVEPNLVRGLDYYTDTVFEIVNSQLGAQSTLLAGGRYDNLIENMGGPKCPSMGWAAGVERLSLLVKQPSAERLKIGVVDMNHSNDNYLMSLSQKLRNFSEIYWSSTGNFSKQMKKCETHGCQFVVLFGDTEIEKKSVQIKNLKSGEQSEVLLADLKDFNFNI
jgi:histidyl-tRNA synthetase